MCCRADVLFVGVRQATGPGNVSSKVLKMLNMLKVRAMRRLGVAVWCGLALTPLGAGAQQMTPAKGIGAESRTGLPAPPKGKPTVLGGTIRSVDTVRDELSLKVFGGKPVKLDFDARTEVFRDGKRVALADLHPEERASVETVLDGTSVYVLSVHMLSQEPEGNCQGQVMDYNLGSGELTVKCDLSGPIRLRMAAGTPVARVGQQGFAGASGMGDLVRGALVTVSFKADKHENAVVTRIGILATPGAQFVFRGNVTALNMPGGSMVIEDPTDGKTYQVSFDAAALPVKNLHEGEHVVVKASFDGQRYMAMSISQ
jgi:hypothetical protein